LILILILTVAADIKTLRPNIAYLVIVISSSMHSHLAQRLRRNSLSSVPPQRSSPEYSTSLADLSAHILYRSPLPSQSNLPIFVLNAAAFPDAKEVDYDALLPYVLSRLPGEEELIGGKGYEILFLAGGGDDGTTAAKKGRPGWGWFVQAYHVVSGHPGDEFDIGSS
jgi:Rho GTPase-activating protein 1